MSKALHLLDPLAGIVHSQNPTAPAVTARCAHSVVNAAPRVAPHLLHIFSTFVAGGPQQRTARLIAGLGEEFRHSIVALDGQTDAAALLDALPNARVLESDRVKGARDCIRRVRNLVQSVQPDAVLTYNFGAVDAVLAARSAGVRAVIHHEDGFGPDEMNGFKRRRVWYRRLVLRNAHRVIVVSNRLREAAAELWRVPSLRLVFIPNGIDLVDYERGDGNPELRTALGIPQDALVIGAVGHLRTEKNFARLLNVFARLACVQSAHLIIVGDGPQRRELATMAAELGISERVHLLGHQDDPRPYYRAMSIFCVSSDTEQMPISMLEAMATELPVASTDVGDIKLMLPEEGRAFVVPLSKEDTDASLAAALMALERDGALREKLGASNREKVKDHYSFEAMQMAYRAIYRSALQAS